MPCEDVGLKSYGKHTAVCLLWPFLNKYVNNKSTILTMTSQAVTSIATGIAAQLCCHNRENIDVTGVLCFAMYERTSKAWSREE